MLNLCSMDRKYGVGSYGPEMQMDLKCRDGFDFVFRNRTTHY